MGLVAFIEEVCAGWKQFVLERGHGDVSLYAGDFLDAARYHFSLK